MNKTDKSLNKLGSQNTTSFIYFKAFKLQLGLYFILQLASTYSKASVTLTLKSGLIENQNLTLTKIFVHYPRSIFIHSSGPSHFRDRFQGELVDFSKPLSY